MLRVFPLSLFLLCLSTLLVIGTGCDESSSSNSSNNNVNNENNSNNSNNSNNTSHTNNTVPLEVQITSPLSGIVVTEGKSLSFAAEVTGGMPPYAFLWDFDDSAPQAAVQNPGETVLHNPGSRDITLTVRDSAGLTRSTTVSITIDDLHGAMNRYFGNLHSHSGLSDGEGSAVEVLTWARDTAGVDFYAMTDHSEQLSESEWEEMQVQTDAFNQDGIFTALRGFEWSHPWNGHMCIYTTTEYNSAYSAIWISYIYDWLDENSALAQFNHPGREDGVFNDLAYEAYVADNMFAIETGNKGDGNNDGEFLPYYIQALDNGWRVAPTSNQDNHSMNMNSHRSVFLASELSRERLLEAMRERRFYSSDDPNTHVTFRAGDTWMGSTLAMPAGELEFGVKVTDDEPILSLEIISVGGTVAARFDAPADTTSVVWYPRVTVTANGWYFLKVTAQDLYDDDGPEQIAVTAPIWVTVN